MLLKELRGILRGPKEAKRNKQTTPLEFNNKP